MLTAWLGLCGLICVFHSCSNHRVHKIVVVSRPLAQLMRNFCSRPRFHVQPSAEKVIRDPHDGFIGEAAAYDWSFSRRTHIQS
jgi:hypothetical protein